MKIDADTLMAAIEEDNYYGFCLVCGYQQDGCEPDARNYECEACGNEMVFGAQEILMIGEYE